MRPVQPLLILVLLVVVYLYFSRLRSGLLDRLIVLVFALTGMVLVVFPGLTTRIAVLVGVGRGADLFMYLSLVGLGFFGLLLYSKLRELEGSLTEVTRALAIRDARAPGGPSRSPASNATSDPAPGEERS